MDPENKSEVVELEDEEDEPIDPKVIELFTLERQAMQLAAKAESRRCDAALIRRDLKENQRYQYEYVRDLYRIALQRGEATMFEMPTETTLVPKPKAAGK